MNVVEIGYEDMNWIDCLRIMTIGGVQPLSNIYLLVDSDLRVVWEKTNVKTKCWLENTGRPNCRWDGNIRVDIWEIRGQSQTTELSLELLDIAS
jgi:hypothetical protein